MEHMYSQADQLPNSSTQIKHKEEGNKRRKLDFDDRENISSELAKHSHPLTVQSEVLYNIVNGQVAPADVNVDEEVDIGQTMTSSFRNNLANGYHGKISNQVKTMEQLKRAIKVGGKTIFDLGGHRHSSSGSRASSTVAANNYIPVRVVCGPSITH